MKDDLLIIDLLTRIIKEINNEQRYLSAELDNYSYHYGLEKAKDIVKGEYAKLIR